MQDNGPEYFNFLTFQWDVAKAKRLVGNRKPSADIKVGEFYRMWLEGHDLPDRIPLIALDLEHAMSDEVDTTEPLIAVLLPKEDDDEVAQGVLIDGWHRAYKAYHTGVKKLDMHVLTPEEERECRTQGTFPSENKINRETELQNIVDWAYDEAPTHLPSFVRAAQQKGYDVQVVIVDPREWPQDDNIMVVLDVDVTCRVLTGSGEELIRYYR